MIRLRNRSEEIVDTFGVPGTQASSATAKVVWVSPGNYKIKAVLGRLRTAGSGGGSQTVEIRKNGTSIMGSGNPTMTFANAATPTYGTASPNPPTLAKGDIVSLVVTAVDNTPGVDLAVSLSLIRQREIAPGDGQLQTDTVLGADADTIS